MYSKHYGSLEKCASHVTLFVQALLLELAALVINFSGKESQMKQKCT